MNIFKSVNYNRNISTIDIKVDVKKHLSLYVLMNNIYTSCYNNYTDKPLTHLTHSNLQHYYNLFNKKYPKITYEQFIQDPVLNNIMVYNRDGYVYKRDIKNILFYKTLKTLGRQGNFITGLGSLINTSNFDKLEYVFTLCVRKGYEKYVQLCLILDLEFEFDCLYFIYTKYTLTKHVRSIDLYLLKQMLTYCKNYKIDTLVLEDFNINRELEYDFKAEFSKLPNIKAMKDKLNSIHQLVIANGL